MHAYILADSYITSLKAHGEELLLTDLSFINETLDRQSPAVLSDAKKHQKAAAKRPTTAA